MDSKEPTLSGGLDRAPLRDLSIDFDLQSGDRVTDPIARVGGEFRVHLDPEEIGSLGDSSDSGRPGSCERVEDDRPRSIRSSWRTNQANHPSHKRDRLRSRMQIPTSEAGALFRGRGFWSVSEDREESRSSACVA